VAQAVALLWVRQQERLAHLLELQHKPHRQAEQDTATLAVQAGGVQAFGIKAEAEAERVRQGKMHHKTIPLRVPMVAMVFNRL